MNLVFFNSRGLPIPFRFIVNAAGQDPGRTEYSDTSVYRFAVSNNLNIVTRTTTTTYTEKTSTGTNRYSTSPSARTAYLSFSFYDRINGQQHPNTGNSSAKLAYAVAAFSELVKRAKK